MAYQHGCAESPSAYLAQLGGELAVGRLSEVLSLYEHALAVCETRNDETAASVVIGAGLVGIRTAG